jgi:hypothetical protein
MRHNPALADQSAMSTINRDLRECLWRWPMMNFTNHNRE